MNIAPINSTNFGKFYIQGDDYNSAQEQYLCDINSKLNNRSMSTTYADKLEKMGYDIWATPGVISSDKIRVMLTKHNVYIDEPTRGFNIATVGEYTTDFNPQMAIKSAEDDIKVNKIFKSVLLGIASIFAILAIAKGCTENIAKNKAVSNTVEKAGDFVNNFAKTAKTFRV